MSFRYPRKRPQSYAAACLLLLWLGLRWGADVVWPSTNPSADRPLRPGPCEVLKILGSDAFLVRQSATDPGPGDLPRFCTRPVQIRLWGIEIPNESRRVVEYCSTFLSAGAPRLEFDKYRLDRSGWFVALVRVNGQLLNEQLLRDGLARLALPPGASARLARQFQAAQSEAQRARRGIWRRFVESG